MIVPAAGGGVPPVNVLSVDVEEHFQVSAFEAVVQPRDWPRHESRVGRNTERMLRLFGDAGVKATFFVLGWVGERHPSLVRAIAAEGHEVASHGYAHRLVYDQTVEEFRDDVRRSRALLESIVGGPVIGYRAPSFSITERSRWALDVLIEEGYLYDASIYPIYHDRYGIPDAPRHPHWIERPAGRLLEVPGSTVRMAGVNMPCGGGGYFRLLPYWWTRWAVRHLNEFEQRSAVFYIHPWELDADQPRLPAKALSRFRHYHNLSRTEARLRALLSEFRFGPCSTMFEPAAGLAHLRATAPVLLT